MSLAFIRENSSAVTGMLSTRIKGSTESLLMEPIPRILYFGEELALPSVTVMLRLGTAPCKPSPALDSERFSSTLEDTASTAPDIFTFFWVP